MRSNRTMMFAGVMGLLGTALAASAPMEPGAPEAEPGSTKYNPRRASGSKPVPGGGKRERVKRLSRIVRSWVDAQSWHPTGKEMPGVTREQITDYVSNQFPDLDADMRASVVEASI